MYNVNTINQDLITLNKQSITVYFALIISWLYNKNTKPSNLMFSVIQETVISYPQSSVH